MKPAFFFQFPFYFSFSLPFCLSIVLSLPARPVSAYPSPVRPVSAAGQHAASTQFPAGRGASLLGIKIGMDRDDAHAALAAAGASSTERSAVPDKDAAEKKKAGDPDAAVPEVWTLKGTPYGKIVFAADNDDKVIWVTGFARPGQGVPFAQLGSLPQAAASGPAFAVWNVISPHGSYRKIARGQGGKAMVVSLLPLRSADPNGAFSPQIIPKTIPKQIIPKTMLETDSRVLPKAGTGQPK